VQSACSEPFTATAYAENGFGERAWEYQQTVTVRTYGDPGIDDASCSAKGEGKIWGWSFQEHLSYCIVELGGGGWNTIKSFSQGRFEFNVGPFGTWNSAEPSIWQQVSDDGGYWEWKDYS
jgi:hypothetical protein